MSTAHRILVIEDEEAIRDLVRMILERNGYEVVVAQDGQQGIDLAAARRPDLVLCDLMLPRVHGYEVIRELRRRPSTRRVPILVLSAKAYEPDRRKAIELGALSFLPKPFRAEALIDLVSRVLTTPRVRFWGVRGSIATPGPDTVRYGGNTPCVTLELGRETLILDSGTGARDLGLCLQAEAVGQPLDLRMLITHTHWDHIQGFPFFVPAFVPGNHLQVYGPPSIEKPLDKVLRGQMDPAYFPVALGDMAARIDVHDVRDPDFVVGPFRVRALYVNHPGVTMSYRIEAHGKVIVYATDAEPFESHLTGPAADDELRGFARDRDEPLRTLIEGADLYIGDSQYAPEEYAQRRGWGHTCYFDTVQTAIDARARRLALFSHDPMHDDDAVDRKLERCRAYARDAGSPLEVHAAIEGATIDLLD